MFGVVIWSDTDEGKAVIWCDDHGDLAFYRQKDHGKRVHMDPGDLVQFDLSRNRAQRIACNPRLVAEGVYEGISDQLSGAMPDVARGASARETAGCMHVGDDATVVPLQSFRERLTGSRPAQRRATAG